MQHLQCAAELSGLLLHLSGKSQFSTALKALTHFRVKMKKADFDGSGSVRNSGDELHETTALSTTRSDSGLNLSPVARFEVADSGNSSLVLIAKRKMKNKIPIVDQAQASDTLCSRD